MKKDYMKNLNKEEKMKELKTKEGAASIYVVVVCALLFSVITAGFITLMLNETRKSGENSLSQSAYDSALAGVEDAKNLIKQKGNDLSDYLAGSGNKTGDCVKINGDSINGDITETSSGSGTTYQEYTCVDIKLKNDDYRATLGGSQSTAHLVPLGSSTPAKIELSWYSKENLGTQDTNFANINESSNVVFGNTQSNPPVLVMQFFQKESDSDIGIYGDSSSYGTNRGTLWLVPTDKNDGKINLDKEFLINSNKHVVDEKHEANKINCSSVSAGAESTNEFICSVTISLPNTYGNKVGVDPFLVLNLPYGGPETDFKVEMKESNGTSRQFDNIQASIDSTGRANDVYSRVETRIDLFDSTFPIPEYAMTLDGEENTTTLDKDFYVW